MSKFPSKALRRSQIVVISACYANLDALEGRLLCLFMPALAKKGTDCKPFGNRRLRARPEAAGCKSLKQRLG